MRKEVKHLPNKVTQATLKTNIWEEQQAQVNAMADASGMDQETIINWAITEYYKGFISALEDEEDKT